RVPQVYDVRLEGGAGLVKSDEGLPAIGRQGMEVEFQRHEPSRSGVDDNSQVRQAARTHEGSACSALGAILPRPHGFAERYFFDSGAFIIQRCPNGSRSMAKRASQNISDGANTLLHPASMARL